MPDLVWSVGRVALASYVGLMLLMFFRQAKYIYYPSRSLNATPATARLNYSEVLVQTSDGETIHGWFVPVENPLATVLFCHGNAGNIWDRIDVIWKLHEMGLNVCVFDYRGYGKSTGRPSEQGTYRDAEAVWTHLVVERGLTADQIVVWGESLGGAVAAWVAETKRPGALILESTFTSLPDLASRFYPFLPVRWLCRFRYPTLARLAEINCPVLVAHSPDDEMIPFAMGQKLYLAAREPKQFLTMRGSHNTGRETSGKMFEEEVLTFLREQIGKNPR
jgi:pimeloyl-ACP methyl ester carboxylesterase